MKRFLLALVFLVSMVSARAQYIVVSGSGLTDGTGAAVDNATITFTPVSNSGVPLSFRKGSSGGQTIVAPVSAPVADGSFTIQLVDSAQTMPVNACYDVKVIDNVSGSNLLGPGYGCVQPTSGSSGWCTVADGAPTCNFDAYQPNLASGVMVQTGPPGPVGPQGPQGTAVASVNCQNNSGDITLMRAAITALTPNGGNIRSSKNCYYYDHTLSDGAALTFTAPISIDGQGGTWSFDLAPGMDRMAVAPAAITAYPYIAGSNNTLYYFSTVLWSNMTLVDVTSPPGGIASSAFAQVARNSIRLDASNGGMAHFTLDNINSMPVATGFGVFMWNDTSSTGIPSGQSAQTHQDPNGGFFLSTIRDSTIWGGIKLHDSGDTLLIHHDQITAFVNDGVAVDSISGSVDNTISNNNIISAGCPIHLLGGNNFHLHDNEVGISSYFTTTCTTGTVSVDGAVDGVDIEGGTIGADQGSHNPYPNLPLIYVGPNAVNTRIKKTKLIASKNRPAAISNLGAFTCIAPDVKAQNGNDSLPLLSGNGSNCGADARSLEGLGDISGPWENRLPYSEDLTHWSVSHGGVGSDAAPSLASTFLPDGTTGNGSRLVLKLNGGTTSGDTSVISQFLTGMPNPHTSVESTWAMSNSMVTGVSCTGSSNPYSCTYSLSSVTGIPTAINGHAFTIANASPSTCNQTGATVTAVDNTANTVTVNSSTNCTWSSGGNVVFSFELANFVAGSAQVFSVGFGTPSAPYFGWSKIVTGQPSATSSTTDSYIIQLFGGTNFVSDSADIIFWGSQVCSGKPCRYVKTAATPQSATYTPPRATMADSLTSTPSQCGSHQFSTGNAANGNANCLNRYGVITAYDNNAVTSSFNIQGYTPSSALTVTHIDVRLNTQPVGCATPPQACFGTACLAIPNSGSGVLVSGTPTGTTTYPSGTVAWVNHQAGTGCSTNANILSITVEYAQ